MGFEWAITHSALSHYDPTIHTSQQAWAEQMRTSPVRVQWDPDRSPTLGPLRRRAIQVGLSGEAVDRYLDEWIAAITDITSKARRIQSLIKSGGLATAQAEMPIECDYPLPPLMGARTGATASQVSEDGD